ncbi:MAG TPA: hypothetical protein VHQ70_10740, partial [Syntrophomonadaceae bacterium]|nr:hypothetical protein [Syntrophomonadaceae bacterium]
LIYYYFEGKDKILEELTKQQTAEAMAFKDSLYKNEGLDKDAVPDLNFMEHFKSKTISNGTFDQYLNQVFDFNKKQKDILSILMIEALKANGNQETFFRMLEMHFHEALERVHINDPDNYPAFFTRTVFFAYIPLAAFVIFGEKWCEHNHLDYKTIEIIFKQMLKKQL